MTHDNGSDAQSRVTVLPGFGAPVQIFYVLHGWNICRSSSHLHQGFFLTLAELGATAILRVYGLFLCTFKNSYATTLSVTSFFYF